MYSASGTLEKMKPTVSSGSYPTTEGKGSALRRYKSYRGMPKAYPHSWLVRPRLADGGGLPTGRLAGCRGYKRKMPERCCKASRAAAEEKEERWQPPAGTELENPMCAPCWPTSANAFCRLRLTNGPVRRTKCTHGPVQRNTSTSESSWRTSPTNVYPESPQPPLFIRPSGLRPRTPGPCFNCAQMGYLRAHCPHRMGGLYPFEKNAHMCTEGVESASHTIVSHEYIGSVNTLPLNVTENVDCVSHTHCVPCEGVDNANLVGSKVTESMLYKWFDIFLIEASY